MQMQEHFHDSMKFHPDPKPHMAYLFHQEKAPRGKLMLQSEAVQLDGKDGWVDSPKKFRSAKEKQDDGLNFAEKKVEVTNKSPVLKF